MAFFHGPESVLVVVYTDQAEVLLLKRRAPFSFWQSASQWVDMATAIDTVWSRTNKEALQQLRDEL